MCDVRSANVAGRILWMYTMFTSSKQSRRGRRGQRAVYVAVVFDLTRKTYDLAMIWNGEGYEEKVVVALSAFVCTDGRSSARARSSFRNYHVPPVPSECPRYHLLYYQLTLTAPLAAHGSTCPAQGYEIEPQIARQSIVHRKTETEKRERC